jgi:hypothetical protein
MLYFHTQGRVMGKKPVGLDKIKLSYLVATNLMATSLTKLVQVGSS